MKRKNHDKVRRVVSVPAKAGLMKRELNVSLFRIELTLLLSIHSASKLKMQIEWLIIKQDARATIELFLNLNVLFGQDIETCLAIDLNRNILQNRHGSWGPLFWLVF
jgi:hypothetical protein